MQKILLLLLSMSAFYGQPSGKIYFRNASVEDRPGTGKSPTGWYSATKGSTPDILPGGWDIQFPAQDGKTCVGLVIRKDGSSEDLSQALSAPLQGGRCYSMSLYLAHAAKYVGHNGPACIRIWGGNSRGEKKQLLYTSPMINHPDWRAYKFQMNPASALSHLTFEAWFPPGVLFKYNGNIILDNFSPLEKCERA